MSSLPVSFFNKSIVEDKCCTQLVIKTSHNMIKELVREISNKAIGFRVGMTMDKMYKVNEPVEPIALPENIPNLENQAKWMVERFPLDTSKRCAAIGYTYDSVVLNCSHSVADGDYYKLIIDYIQGKKVPEDHCVDFPEDPEVVLKDVYMNLPKQNEEKSLLLVTKTFDKSKISGPTFFQSFNIPNYLVKCYNTNTKQLDGVAAAARNAMIVIGSAFNGSFDKAAVRLAIGTRRYMKNPGWNVPNALVCQVATAKGINANSTLGEMKKQLNSSIKSMVESKSCLSQYAAYQAGDVHYSKGVGIDTSHIGRFEIAGQIKGIYIGMSCNQPAHLEGDVQLQTYEAGGRLYGRMRFPAAHFTLHEAAQLSRRAKYFLSHCSDSMTVADAIEAVSKVK